MTDLKPCPFCGSNDVSLFEDGVLFWGHCYKCEAEGPLKDDGQEAVDAWNRRVTDGGRTD